MLKCIKEDQRTEVGSRKTSDNMIWCVISKITGYHVENELEGSQSARGEISSLAGAATQVRDADGLGQDGGSVVEELP